MREVLVFKNRPSILAADAVVGKKESEGPLGRYFDRVEADTTLGKPTWEQAESELQRRALLAALQGAGCDAQQLDVVFGGDLQAQCTASGYTARAVGRPFYNVYGACSTMSQSLLGAAAFVDGGYAETAGALTSSHFCAAERQFRFPLEYGGQRTPTSQWTVTAAGCCIVGRSTPGRPYIHFATVGRVIDYGVNDINNMGAAMAPAAADTLTRYLAATGTRTDDYDTVVTGDLGNVGSELLRQLLSQRGIELRNHLDCGCIIYDTTRSDVGAGGSGCGCSAAVLCKCLLPQLLAGQSRNILFMATGALMSTALYQQGETIPAVAHLINIRI